MMIDEVETLMMMMMEWMKDEMKENGNDPLESD